MFPASVVLFVCLLSACAWVAPTLGTSATLPEATGHHRERRQVMSFPNGVPADARYAVMVDAGSKDSRAYAYWYASAEAGAQASALPKIDRVVSARGRQAKLKLSPGLDKFQNNLAGLDASFIKPMLDFANSYAPADKSFISILETAGMRLLSEDKQSEINDYIKQRIPALGNNRQVKDSRVISGADEGAFGWLAVNYMLGRFEVDRAFRLPPYMIQSRCTEFTAVSLEVPGLAKYGLRVVGIRATNSSYVRVRIAGTEALQYPGVLDDWAPALVQSYSLGVENKSRGFYDDLYLCLEPTASSGGSRYCRPATVGAFQMGGASIQFAYEFDTPQATSGYPLPPDTRVEVDLLGRPDGETLYRIYSKSHLEYGVDEALGRYGSALLRRFQANPLFYQPESFDNLPRPGTAGPVNVYDPCALREANILQRRRRRAANPFQRVGTGEFDACVRLLRDLILETQCTSPVPAWRQNCTIRGVVQPVLPRSRYQFVGLGGYYEGYDNPQERMVGKKRGVKAPAPEVKLHEATAFDTKDFLQRLREVCRVPITTTMEDFINGEFKLKPETDEALVNRMCFHAAWLHAVLQDGYMLGKKTKHLTLIDKISGREVSWTLGALLASNSQNYVSGAT